MKIKNLVILIALLLSYSSSNAQFYDDAEQSTLYDVPPRFLIDCPTAGTMDRGHYQIGSRFYPNGGAISFADIGLSNRLTIGISYGGEQVISNNSPNWNPKIEFNLKFRPIDELEYFPAITVGFSSQGYGAWIDEWDRYTFKSRGFFAVASRSFYFYQWTAGWHAGINYSLEDDVDEQSDLNFFLGFDATFKYNLALLLEFDAALNDNRSTAPAGVTNLLSGKGRGYLNSSMKWLFTESLELEFILKDLLVNRRDSETITRELRITYIAKF